MGALQHNGNAPKIVCHCEEAPQGRRGNLLWRLWKIQQEIATSGGFAALLAMTTLFFPFPSYVYTPGSRRTGGVFVVILWIAVLAQLKYSFASILHMDGRLLAFSHKFPVPFYSIPKHIHHPLLDRRYIQCYHKLWPYWDD